MSENQNKQKNKEELKLLLLEQAEKQLVEAVQKAEQSVVDAQKSLQEAQSNRIALHAQLQLLRRIDEKANEMFMTQNASQATP